MRRRTYLLTAGTIGTTLLAGCSGSEEDDQTTESEAEADEGGTEDSQKQDDESGSQDQGQEEGGDETSSSEVQNRPEGEDVLEAGNLVIREHELVVEEENGFEDVTVEGIIENTGDAVADYVEVGVRVYDADGNHLDRYWTNTTKLQAGGTWAFEVMINEDSEDIESYDIGVADSAV